jgi:hypothetical protein
MVAAKEVASDYMSMKPLYFYGKAAPETVLWCMCELAAERSGFVNSVTSRDAYEMMLSASIDEDNSDARIVNTPFGMALSFGRDCLMDVTSYDNMFGNGMAKEALIRAIARCRVVTNECSTNRWSCI